MAFEIPAELVAMLAERRVIPFIGAGFSVSLGLPDWDALLAKVAAEIDATIPYDDLKKYCNSDPLQIAEYLYLRSDKSIGPLRLRISNELMPRATAPVRSGAHVELVNLGAAQIYTTNFDEMIERTFRDLAVPVEVVAVAKDVATATGARTQIVKYHGDLRFDATLVLTESSYYTRLDFESPMDLKFRSDLLGRSVLFMGYSFRDINIRVIWFKLMQMMKDIPEADRPKSYIVRFDKNPVLEALYESVGIRTIVLDPDGAASTPEQRTALFADFMLALSMRVDREGRMPGQARHMFISTRLIERAREGLKTGRRSLRSSMVRTRPDFDAAPLRHVAVRQIPPPLARDVAELLLDIARSDVALTSGNVPLAHIAVTYAKNFGAAPGVTMGAAMALMRQPGREALLGSPNVPWKALWSNALDGSDATALIKVLVNEVSAHRHQNILDEDIAYAVDVVSRLKLGMLSKDEEVQRAASTALDDAAKLYESIAAYTPQADGPPNVSEIVEEINAAVEAESAPEDDVPF
jgi:hypothetical protein